MHAYIIDGFKKVSLFLNLKKVDGGGFSNNLTLLILRSLEEYGGLTVEWIANKVVCFGSNGISMYCCPHGCCYLAKVQNGTFLTTMHCMAHHTNVVRCKFFCFAFGF